jgi:hypothetical protein
VQESAVVQALPSSHEEPSALAGLEHVPVLVSQVPAEWHWSDAVQVLGVPAQEPEEQVSLVVQGFPSSQTVPLGEFVWTHVPFVHESVVQGLPSSQSLADVQPPVFPPPPPEPPDPEPPEPPPVPVVPPVAGVVHVPHTPPLQLAIFPPVQVVEQSVPSNLFVN